MTSINTNKNLNSLDLAKFILSFCVIAIHVNPLMGIDNQIVSAIYESIVRCAVPVFFLASGYLLSRKIQKPFFAKENIGSIKKYMKSSLKLYLKWTVIYLPITIVYFVKMRAGILKALGTFLYNVVIFGQNYNSWPLWYLLSTFYAAVFILFCMRRRVSLKRILILGTILAIIGISLNVFYRIQCSNTFIGAAQHALEWIVPDGRIFGGFFYIPLGMYINQNEEKFLKKFQRTKLLVILFIMALAVRIISNATFLADYMSVICGILLFVLILRIRLRDRPFYKILRSISMYNFLLHMYVWTILYSIIYGSKEQGLFMFILTAAATTLLSYGIVFLKKKLYNRCYGNRC